MGRRVLGRGLSALIPDRTKAADTARVENLKVEEIKPNKYQPREEFDSQKLNELISSIKEKGVIQPILVRKTGDEYELIAGERRLRAAKSLGMENVPALIKDVDDSDMLGLALIENIQRDDLNAIEEAHAYQKLMEEFHFSQDRIGQMVGMDRTSISNSIRLLSLPSKIQDYLVSGMLNVGHAKVLLSVPNSSLQMELAKKIMSKGMSVRSLERLLKKKKAVKKFTSVDYDLHAIEDNLRQILGTKVKILKGKKRGRIEIEFYSENDLDRILKIMSKDGI